METAIRAAAESVHSWAFTMNFDHQQTIAAGVGDRVATWTVEKIERELLLADIETIVRPAQTIVEAINRAHRMLGAEWVASESIHKGLASAMRIVGMGLRLETIEGLPRSEELLQKLRQQDSSADAELTGIHLLCSRSPDVAVELFPAVRTREADFRVRKGIEEWTTVEVTQATESKEQKRLNEILKRLTAAFGPLDCPFSLEVILQREPTEDEITRLCETLPQFCFDRESKTAHLIDGLGMLLLNQVPVGQLPHSEIPESANIPSIGLAAFFRTDRVITVKVPFNDDRAERMLREESQQLPSGKRGLVMISGPSSKKELKVWAPLIQRRFQPNILTRVSGVCLFDGGMVPAGKRIDWQIQGHLILNPHAKSALPSWIEQTIIAANMAFERSFAESKSGSE